MNQTPLKKASRIQQRNQAVEIRSDWRSGALLPSLLSSILLLAAFPPLGWSWLAWVGPAGWLLICQRAKSPGRRGYFAIWFSGCLFWLVALHSIRLAFWALYAGWIAMSLYLAIYAMLFVASTRIMVHRWKLPLVIAAPVAWCGLEMIRSYLLTGYAANTLAHSQAFQPSAIQVVDQLGIGGLSFLMMMFSAALLKTFLRFQSARWLHAAVPATTAGLLLILIMGYGKWRLNQADKLADQQSPLMRCLLLQENTPSIFEMSPDLNEYFDRTEAYWTRYLNLCRSAIQQHGPVDLVVWPESTFTAAGGYVDARFDGDRLPSRLEMEMQSHGISQSEFRQRIEQSNAYFDFRVRLALLAARGLETREEARVGLREGQDQSMGKQDSAPDASSEENMADSSSGPHLLVGCDHLQYTSEEIRRHNAAIWIGPDGVVRDYYAKMHLVMFGEYIPLKPMLSWLGDLFSFADANPGAEPKSFEMLGTWVAPNICFESMVPWLIRWQVRELCQQGKSPQLLINLTNDSWFRGTVMLDHHLASSIMCCVENRRPMLVAANTGLSAEIDGSGRVRKVADRLTAQALLAEPKADGRWGLVQSIGYPLSWLCLALTIASFLWNPCWSVYNRIRKPTALAN